VGALRSPSLPAEARFAALGRPRRSPARAPRAPFGGPRAARAPPPGLAPLDPSPLRGLAPSGRAASRLVPKWWGETRRGSVTGRLL